MNHAIGSSRKIAFGVRGKFLVPVVLLVIAAISGLAYQFSNHSPERPSTASPSPPIRQAVSVTPASTAIGSATVIELPKSQWEVSGLAFEPVSMAPFVQTIRLTGKVSLNEDRIAHIYPMVDGEVESVQVGLGQAVHADDPLVIVHSREIGRAKLELYQARLQHEMALAKDKIQRGTAENAQELLASLREGLSITDIEKKFRHRGMGDYRERLLLSYSSYLKSAADVARLEGLAESGAVSGKQFLAANSNMNADQATFQARIEQVDYELQMSLLQSSQAVREAATRVAVATSNLQILGCRDEEIASIDPKSEGESISHYWIRAPFDGTVISKDVSLKEQVHTDTQILRIADLSTVWISADIYEENVPILKTLAGKAVRVRNQAWPDREFEAEVFFTGEIMDEATRTISMRAVANNEDRLLKPGMFVTIELDEQAQQQSLAVPLSAVQEHAGQQFVYLHLGEGKFERRDVVLGKRNKQAVEVLDGLTEGDEVVVSGGFVLKSKMLEDLMGEE